MDLRKRKKKEGNIIKKDYLELRKRRRKDGNIIKKEMKEKIEENIGRKVKLEFEILLFLF